jgi:A/G-specific adenine glycosylase
MIAVAKKTKKANAGAQKKIQIKTFAQHVIEWQKTHGRNSLPWQNTNDAYRIWLSEVMLQQTQVVTVIPYFQDFLKRFPSVVHLADAPEDAVMSAWSGLGYYSRARNLHRAAKIVRDDFAGVFPMDSVTLETLPGVGRSTAAAIAVFSSGEQAAILDGNVKRVLSRYFGVKRAASEQKWVDSLWGFAEQSLPNLLTRLPPNALKAKSVVSQDIKPIQRYTQGLMDLGATCCTIKSPQCTRCPVAVDCFAYTNNATESLPGSRIKKAVPLRHTNMFVLIDGEKLLLQKRPPTGVWPSLWSLPEVEGDENLSVDITTPMTKRLGLKVKPARGAKEKVASDASESQFQLTHTFTHFRLKINVHVVHVTVAGNIAHEANDMQWHAVEDALQLGIPKPIRTILLKVRK